MEQINRATFLNLNNRVDTITYLVDGTKVEFIELSYTEDGIWYKRICYGQNRLIEVWESKNSEIDSCYYIISEFCTIPEFDNILAKIK